MIDWDRIETLREEVGEDALQEVIGLFLEEVDEVIAQLEAHPDPKTYEKDLHFLKGSALNLGFSDLGALCQRGEREAANGDATRVDIAAVIAVYRTSRDYFLTTLNGLLKAG